MDVKCKKITCGFNQSTICMADEITVSKNLDCKSFTNKSTKKKINKKYKENFFEVGNELTEYVPCHNKHVNCNKTECLFNKNRECTSNGITLNSENKTAMCVSYVKE